MVSAQVYHVAEKPCLENYVTVWSAYLCVHGPPVCPFTLHNTTLLLANFSLKSASAQHSLIILLWAVLWKILTNKKK